MLNFQEKSHFVEDHFLEIKPLLDKSEEDLTPDSEKAVDLMLGEYKNKLFYEEMPNFEPEAKRILFTANDPGGYGAIEPLIIALESDRRCKGVGVLASGYARKNLELKFKERLVEVKSESPVLIQQVMEFSQQNPLDAVVETVSALNGPESIALYGGRSNLGAKKVYLIAEGWGTLGSQFAGGNEGQMDEIEAILCADEVSKKIFHRQLPNIPEDKFEITGSPVIDELRVENPAVFAEQARKKFRLGENTLAILFIGDVSADYSKERGYDELINEKTFSQTLESVIKLAADNPNQEYALLVRPHPRDPNKAEMFARAKKEQLPVNLKVIPAGKDSTSIQEVRYASDVIISIASTENFLTPSLRRTAIFLGFKQGNLGGKALDLFYGQKLMDQITAVGPKIHVADSPHQLIGILKNAGRAVPNYDDLPVFKRDKSIDAIKNRILAD